MTKHWRDDLIPATGRQPIGKAFTLRTSSLKDSAAPFAAPHGARFVKKTKKTLTFDSLEPRYLLSADISPYIDAIDDGLDRLSLLIDDAP